MRPLTPEPWSAFDIGLEANRAFYLILLDQVPVDYSSRFPRHVLSEEVEGTRSTRMVPVSAI
jgi:hypothetical protein